MMRPVLAVPRQNARRAHASRAMSCLAAGLLASMTLTALHDASQAWDVGYYHLPFAGRLAGLLPAQEYVFSRPNEGRFRGFPLLAELLQGLLWRLTGRPESTNLVALASVPLLAWFARARFGVAWAVSALALLAIPLVHMHATSAYVDLPGNAAASVVVLLAMDAWAVDRAVDVHTILLASLTALVAANTKPMLQPIVAAALLTLGARVVQRGPRAESVRLLALLVATLPLVFATPLKNALVFGNPYFPVRLSILGHVLPGDEDAYASSPTWLADWPRPVRFACSVFEAGLRSFNDPRRWTIDQYAPPDHPGYRLGGFFNAYVLVHLVLLGWRGVRRRSREVVVALIGFGALTLLISFLPQSHELRYYMSWMIVLVLVNAWLAARGAGFADDVAVGVVALSALCAVALVTRGIYLYPGGTSFVDLVRAKVDEREIARVLPGERVCVIREPFNVLWAPLFHPGHTYVVQEAEDPSDCRGLRPID